MLGLKSLATRVFGTSNDRKLKKWFPIIELINGFESSIEVLSDSSIKSRIGELRDIFSRDRQEENSSEDFDSYLPEVFALVREASKRTLGQRHFDVQLLGGLALHEGRIAEMKTGEGKTLVATLAAVFNCLSGRGVHVVTVNDYLARRDCDWMGQIYEFLGLSVGCITHGLDDDGRREEYSRDIVYATNNQLGFDYLRDNMKFRLEDMTQRGHHFAIVDEVDSILIDEARTPLVISGAMDDKTDLYIEIDKFIPGLEEDDYEIDEKQKAIFLTDKGNERMESLLSSAGLLHNSSLYETESATLVHHINQGLRAHKLFSRDTDYIVKDDQVIIIDEFTGRMMEGRRYSDGLHQALEAKEGVSIQSENQTMASITFQNYFRLYDRLSGMTGTAATESEEFMDVYGLDVVEIPTNVSVARIDDDDEIYRSRAGKNKAIISLIKQCYSRGQPVLVGTTSIEKSEDLASYLRDAGISNFQVLNARYHAREAEIIAQAGAPGAITIATNMAGRGTDIQLGGNPDIRIREELGDMAAGPARSDREAEIREEVRRLHDEVVSSGGLFVIGTERHESRRIDNQLRGRSGRQGDPGCSRFFLSLEDDLMRIFAPDLMRTTLEKLGLEEDEALTHRWINSSVEKAQSKVEAQNYDARRHLLKFDNVMNDQRKVIFDQRIQIMSGEGISDMVSSMRVEFIDEVVDSCIDSNAYPDQWDVDGLQDRVCSVLHMDIPIRDWCGEDGIAEEEIKSRLYSVSDEAFSSKRSEFGDELSSHIAQAILLQALDGLWREHLVTLENLRRYIGLRGYAQRDPLNEYRTEGFTLFQSLLSRLNALVTERLMSVELSTAPPPDAIDRMIDSVRDSEAHHESPASILSSSPAPFLNPPAEGFSSPEDWVSTPRNAPCPCGSGKKYKHCHGKSVPLRSEKIPRNAPCPCGSGKKYKHCHGALE